jgi:type II secretory pathway pseudopilin PulG
MELMVVIIIISILAVLAIPKMQGQRDDRWVFNNAREVSGLLHRARTRAMARGAAHMVVLRPGAQGTGAGAYLFEALDGPPLPGVPGPNPVSSCKSANWKTDINNFVPGANGNSARIVEAWLVNGPATARIGSQLTLGATTLGGTDVLVYCVTPYGATFVGSGTSSDAAIDVMLASQLFSGDLGVQFQRNAAAGFPGVGILRTVIVVGNSAPRIRSGP